MVVYIHTHTLLKNTDIAPCSRCSTSFFRRTIKKKKNPKPETYLDLPSFSTDVLSTDVLFQHLIQDPTLYLITKSPYSPMTHDSSSVVFHDLDILEGNWSGQYFGECSLIGVCLTCSRVRLRLWIFGKNTTEVMCPSQCILSGIIMLRCLMTGEVNLDHLVRWYLLVGLSTSNQFGGQYFVITQTSCFSFNFHLLILGFIHGSCLQQLL